MKKPSEAPSPSSCRSRSENPNLPSSKAQCIDPIQLSSKTPEKPPERTRNRGVALSISEIRKAAKGIHDRKKLHETTSSKAKTARRQIALLSPRKPNAASDEPFKLPEKYEILGEFFDSMDSSIRLLRLKGSMTSFTNISPKIESLTNRRFTHGHLAQLKFILPEAIVFKKLLVFDERTSCMKPDLHVTINPDAVESDVKLPPECGTLSLRKLFRARLVDFCKSHPEGGDIPEETLPEPFNRPKPDPLLDMLKTPSSSFSTETLSDACAAHPQTILSACMQNSHIADNTDPSNIKKDLSVPVKMSIEALDQRPAVASHMSPSFRRRFSNKSKENVAAHDQQKFPSKENVSESSLKKNSIFEVTKSHPNTSPHELALEATSSKSCPIIHASLDCFTSLSVTPTKTIEYIESKDLKSIDAMSPPAKFVSTPSTPMTATPALPPPKRHHMSPDDNSTCSPNKLVGRPPRRSLKYDICDILPDNLLQSIREKEKIAMEERDPAISQAKKRKKIIASLPKLFNMIHLLFHSRNRSVITREELISKIISNHCDIVDRSEVEEQLHLLLELVPEWISEKLASSGDLLFCINKMSDPVTIRASLEEAK